MTFHYKPDGTGRDSYVISGDGGLHNLEYKGPHEFGKFLRLVVTARLMICRKYEKIDRRKIRRRNIRSSPKSNMDEAIPNYNSLERINEEGREYSPSFEDYQKWIPF